MNKKRIRSEKNKNKINKKNTLNTLEINESMKQEKKNAIY